MKKIILITVLIAGLIVVLSRCSEDAATRVSSIASSPTPIERILLHPEDYKENTTTITGTVAQTGGLGKKAAYCVSDGTGEIWVLAGNNYAPPSGENVTIHGHAKQYFRMGDASMVIFIQSDPAN